MFTFFHFDQGQGFDPLVLLLIALVLEAAIGAMRPVFRFIPHPVVIIGRTIKWFDEKLNREHRTFMDRAVRGAVMVLVLVSLAASIGVGLSWVTMNHDFGWAIEGLLIITLIAQRDLYDRVKDVKVALNDSVEDARAKLSHIVGRDPAYLDGHGVCRAAIESLAENFSDAVVAPVFWYLIFGLPGLLVYKTVNTLDSMVGYKSERYRAFGFASARLDDILNFIPARLSAVYIALAALIAPKCSTWGALKTIVKDAGKHRSVNAGWPEAAMAGALNLQLAGPRKYASETVEDPWIGSGTPLATQGHMDSALYIYVVACLFNALVVAVIAMTRFGA